MEGSVKNTFRTKAPTMEDQLRIKKPPEFSRRFWFDMEERRQNWAKRFRLTGFEKHSKLTQRFDRQR
ncbi:hypothetical protein A2482_02205 [Candidatus Falkowbacteria bacterium RIFOXYC2_FULL_48_21]|uniref:Uncharacterized protein n=1 Tax=Candidatus Falkowbacteria bacterium RIFOXYC2_FULL_48_21 TaxID=1798005 RepID=A0A1F5TCU0_9BACT|nr:MAG: hypothetical protein A2482_02205 [Candidatus Falkowbacteria bacterium RIFOXYC2_FULL_48_21]